MGAAGGQRRVAVYLHHWSTALAGRAATILDAAQATRSGVPFAFKGGACGTCPSLVRDGKIDIRRNYALDPAAIEAGLVVTCQTFPVSDRVTVDYDA